MLCVLAVVIMAGCVSLYSDDPEMRKQVIAQITNEDQLFLIAMDLETYPVNEHGGVTLIMKKGGYCEDVRVAAVKKLLNPACLLKCAAWPEGELLGDSKGGDKIRYNGKEHKLNLSAAVERAGG